MCEGPGASQRLSLWASGGISPAGFPGTDEGGEKQGLAQVGLVWLDLGVWMSPWQWGATKGVCWVAGPLPWAVWRREHRAKSGGRQTSAEAREDVQAGGVAVWTRQGQKCPRHSRGRG